MNEWLLMVNPLIVWSVAACKFAVNLLIFIYNSSFMNTEAAAMFHPLGSWGKMMVGCHSDPGKKFLIEVGSSSSQKLDSRITVKSDFYTV